MKTPTVTSRIVKILQNLPDSPYHQQETGFHAERIEALVGAGKPIHFVLPAFPAKSPNPKKTLSPLPDYGEVLALVHLNGLCRKIAGVYGPGARVTICSDGRVFSDLVQVSDGDVCEYGRGIQEIIASHRLSTLSTYCLEDAFPDLKNFDEMRARLTEAHAEPLETLRDRVRTDSEASQMFNGIHRFMFEDQQALNPKVSKSKVREHAKILAYKVIQRSNAWSSLVESRLPDAVRLSIHPQSAQSKKLWIRLLPSNDIWRTPWHAVALFDGTRYVLTRREEAEAMGAVLTKADGKYPYFSLPLGNTI